MKLFEEPAITDTELISNYSNVQSQVIQKQQQINSLQQQINKLNADITELERAKGTIAQAQAQRQKQSETQKQAQATKQAAQAAQQAAQQAAAPTETTASENQKYPDILITNYLLEDEENFTDNMIYQSKNWYQRPTVEPLLRVSKPHTQYEKRSKEIKKWEEEIDSLQRKEAFVYDNIKSPYFEGIEGEIENFFEEIGFEATEILNSGKYKNDTEKIEALKNAGVANPRETLENFYYYYPEFDPNLEKQNHGSNPAVSESFYDINEAYVDLDLEKKTPEGYIEKSYVFYLRIVEDGKEFIGKVFKDSPDEDWFGVVKIGESKTFKKMSYQPEWNELDIVEYLAEIYDEVEIIEENEFEDEIIAEFEPPLEKY